MQLTFMGANKQVTGSRYCLEAAGKRLLIDCGLFQERQFLERNWMSCPIDVRTIDAVLLTHAHLDHTGLLPRLVREGFHKPVYATSATVELAGLILEDAARLQEEDVAFKQKRHAREGRKSPHPYEPLYTIDDAQKTLALFHRVDYNKPLHLSDSLTITWHEAGHILGSAWLEVEAKENGQTKRIVFSGDIGQDHTPIIRDPAKPLKADYLILESTYGNREHDRSHSIEEQLAQIINQTVERGGNLVIPTFAIERAQELLFYFSRLTRADRIPKLMVFLDSPMAVNATQVFKRHPECLDTQTLEMLSDDESPFQFEGLVLSRSRRQSMAINQLRGSAIIMAGSGMCTGGRIKHHLIRNLPRSEATVLFVGYQSRGTLGRQILDGAQQVRIHGHTYPVQAQIRRLEGVSAHADQPGLVLWSQAIKPTPNQVFLTHGEEDAAQALGETLRDLRGWNVHVPEFGEKVEL